MATNPHRLAALSTLPVVVGVLTVIGGIIWSSYQIRSTWPLTTGTVISAQTVCRKDNKCGGTVYGIGIAIQHIKDGQSVVGNAQTYIWTCDYEEHLENLQRYPPGTKLLVRYNPENVKDLRLSPDLVEGVPKSAVLGILLAGTILGIVFVRVLRAKPIDEARGSDNAPSVGV